jgi:hypothetical protein
LFTTQTLGLNPEILENSEVIERLNDRFDILQNKNDVTRFFGAGCGTDKMKINLSHAFQEYFKNAIICGRDTYAAVYATTKERKLLYLF